MEITEVRIKLMERSEDRLRAFCSITIDDSFVVRDLKIIDGTNGPFVAMPSRKLTGHCGRCNHKNHVRALYCNHCGSKLSLGSDGDFDSPQKLYADVAHPINSRCRQMIQDAVIKGFQAELDRSAQPGYRSRYDDDFDQQSSDQQNIAGTDTNVAGQDAAATGGNHPGPPRPHFLNKKPDRSTQAIRVKDDQDDVFGAGIF